jgi:hypothetical protein
MTKTILQTPWFAQAFDQKVIYSWPQKTGSRWTLPAMEIKHTSKEPEPRYMGVMDHNFVCTWTQRDPSIDTHKKGVRLHTPHWGIRGGGDAKSIKLLKSLTLPPPTTYPNTTVQEQGGRCLDGQDDPRGRHLGS